MIHTMRRAGLLGLMLALVALWGGRLSWYIFRRQRAHAQEDPRYAAMLGGGGFAVAVRKVFLVVVGALAVKLAWDTVLLFVG